MAQPPSETMTFLFTDLQASTRLWEEHPDVMREALAWHDSVLTGSVRAHRGDVVKMTGDGVHAVFAHATDAVAAAIDAQRTLTTIRWEQVGTLLVRMGLHAGPAQRRADDYYGPTVNRAARIAAAAHGGQILLSAHAAELVRDSAPYEVSIVELGQFQLRDLAAP